MTDTDERLLSKSFDDLKVGIILYDPETGAILDANTSLEQLYGYSHTNVH
ncbi:PAS domain S-box protein [Natronoglomus mannanivorans]